MSQPRNTEVCGVEKAIQGKPCDLNRRHLVSTDVHMRIKKLRRRARQIVWEAASLDDLAQKIDLLVLSTATGALTLEGQREVGTEGRFD